MPPADGVAPASGRRVQDREHLYHKHLGHASSGKTEAAHRQHQKRGAPFPGPAVCSRSQWAMGGRNCRELPPLEVSPCGTRRAVQHAPNRESPNPTSVRRHRKSRRLGCRRRHRKASELHCRGRPRAPDLVRTPRTSLPHCSRVERDTLCRLRCSARGDSRGRRSPSGQLGRRSWTPFCYANTVIVHVRTHVRGGSLEPVKDRWLSSGFRHNRQAARFEAHE